MCVFCDQNRIAGEKKGLPTEDEIDAAVEIYLESWQGTGRKEAAFYGGSFTAIPRAIQEQLLKAVKPYIDKGVIDSVRISTRPDSINADDLLFLKGYGVSTIELGIQSMDDEVLKSSKRGHTSEDSRKACRLVKEAGFLLGCQLMVGLPGDTVEKSVASAGKVARMRADFVRIYPALVISGTELEARYRQGDFSPLSLSDAVDISAEMVDLFRSYGIDVIRAGLQPTVDLEKSIVDGPYHPSFGEMVETAIFFKKAERELERMPVRGGEVTFYISPRDESAFRGLRNGNVMRLKERYPSINFNLYREAGLQRGSLVVR